MPEGVPINGKEELDMSRKNRVGYSKKYASAAKSFDRSMNRLAHSVSRVAFGSKSTAKSIPKASPKSHMDEPEFAKVITIEDTAKNNYSLSIPLYVKAQTIKENVDDRSVQEKYDSWKEASAEMNESFDLLNQMLERKE